MNKEHFFGQAKWIGAEKRTLTTFSVVRGTFEIKKSESASLNIVGLGFFKCYINGECINPDTFLPLSSEYESAAMPKNEVFCGHRLYVPTFDISDFVKEGINTIAVQFGGGWYCYNGRPFGLPKLIYRITVCGKDGIREYVSDESCKIGAGFVSNSNLIEHEVQNYEGWNDCFAFGFDDSLWSCAALTESPDTEYCETDCSRDQLIRTLPVRAVENSTGLKIYDCGVNTTGYPVLKLLAKRGETVRVRFSEGILESGELDPTHHHDQELVIISDGTDRTVQPEFMWYGFRYFEVIGEAKPIYVKEIHADVSVSSSFECDNETLNWIYKTFIHTMLTNMHCGHPSDCPHLERRGYTGDGQLTSHAVMTVLDAEKFYQKWMQDIADSQDSISGHVQYTAPYISSGGGPGGWGCAIVEVPYQLYKHYGDVGVLEKYYDRMRNYIEFLEKHSEFGLVTSDQDGNWCLGDWCGPNVMHPDKGVMIRNKQMIIPEAMVNTYFMVKSLKTMCEIARVIRREDDIPEYEEKIDTRKRAIHAAYYSQFDSNFMNNAQGANSYAVDIGIGDKNTYPNMVEYYEKVGFLDTGIFATDIVTRVLFEHGDGDLAVKLLIADGPYGYNQWRKAGATTFNEYWDTNRSRSHNHPMFGAPVAYIFEYLLGIKQQSGSAGYKSVVIAPQSVEQFGYMKGSMKTPQGIISVSYEKDENGVCFIITIPQETKAVFRFADKEIPLSVGENKFTV